MVQFVPFNKYKQNPSLLAKEVLAELPGQVEEYYRLVGKKPKKGNLINIAEM